MRVFIATFLTEASQTAYRRFVRGLTHDHPVLRPVPDGTVHLTWAFCADASDAAIVDLLTVLADVARGLHEIPIAFATPHVLRAGRTPRLIAADVTTGRHEAMKLSLDLSAGLRERIPTLAFQPMKTPHVTLARFSRQASSRDAAAVERAFASDASAVAGLLDRVAVLQLVSSTLGPQGPAYRVLGGSPLET